MQLRAWTSVSNYLAYSIVFRLQGLLVVGDRMGFSIMDLIEISEQSCVSFDVVEQNSFSCNVVDQNFVSSDVALTAKYTKKIVAYEQSDGTEAVKKLNVLRTPKLFVMHSNFDTTSGTVYYVPKVHADVLLVKGNIYDSVDDCIIAYMKYATKTLFVVRKSCQGRLWSGVVKQKYLF
ncbi:hypothetical protein Tco_0638098 [Tanacetum coccineum]